MTEFDADVADLMREAENDYVGIWEVFRLAHRAGRDGKATVAIQALAMVEALLRDPEMLIGQFDGGEFRPWTGERSGWLQRIRAELEQLGREPDIGEVAWVVKRRP
jgi:hypothetical protein